LLNITKKMRINIPSEWAVSKFARFGIFTAVLQWRHYGKWL